MCAYISADEVRYRLALDGFKPSSTIMTDLIAKAERELKVILGGSLTRGIIVKYEDHPVNKILLDNFREIISVSVEGKTLDEYSDIELLTNPDVEKTQGDDIQGWTAVAGTGDTLTHDESYAYIYAHSLKIEKGAAVNSYYKSDTMSFEDLTYYKLSGRLFVDSDTDSNTTIKLEFLDVDDAVTKTYTSAVATEEITQPSAASVVACVSATATDTTQTITIYGVVDNNRIIETVELNGTTSASSVNSFTEIISVKKSSATGGTVTLTTNSAGVTTCTLTANQLEKERWVSVEITGAPTEDAHSMRVSFYVTSSATSGDAYGDTFSLRKRQWFPMIDGVHFQAKRSGKFVIEYNMAEVSGLVRELLRDLTALFCLIYISGGDSSGMNYASMKSAQFQSVGLTATYEKIYRAFQENLATYSGVESSDAEIGELS